MKENVLRVASHMTMRAEGVRSSLVNVKTREGVGNAKADASTDAHNRFGVN
jgi:hypothetical protein